MRGAALLIVLLLVSTGCSSPDADQGMVLTAADSSFADLLADLHGADADALLAMEAGMFAPDNARRDSLLTAQGWTQDAFSAQADAYSAEPGRLLAIYNLAVDIAAGR